MKKTRARRSAGKALEIKGTPVRRKEALARRRVVMGDMWEPGERLLGIGEASGTPWWQQAGRAPSYQ